MAPPHESADDESEESGESEDDELVAAPIGGLGAAQRLKRAKGRRRSGRKMRGAEAFAVRLAAVPVRKATCTPGRRKKQKARSKSAVGARNSSGYEG